MPDLSRLALYGILFVIFVLVSRFLRSFPKTPYHTIKRWNWIKQKLGMPVGRPYDFFVSYKSEDSETVRRVVEGLVASGLKVWFYEYMDVVFVNDEAMIRKAIATGIQQSKRGICFTSNRYFASEICEFELNRLFDQCNSDDIIQIRMLSEPNLSSNSTRLMESPSIEFLSINKCLSSIGEVINHRMSLIENDQTFTQEPSIYSYEEKPYSIDLNGWSIIRNEIGRVSPVNYGGPQFTTSVRKLGIFEGFIAIGPMDEGRSRDEITTGGYADERKHFKETKGLAVDDLFGRKCLGVHLFFLHGYSHIAITTFYRPGVWQRIYSIVLPTKDHKADIEFAIIFLFLGSFLEFCHHTYLMDKVVNSFKYEKTN